MSEEWRTDELITQYGKKLGATNSTSFLSFSVENLKR
jgi:hypothetical protein